LHGDPISAFQTFSLAFGLRAVTLCSGAIVHADILPSLNDLSSGDWQAVGIVNTEGAKGIAQCTGTLVAVDRVLTAAHCVRGSGGTDTAHYFVVGGIGAEDPPVFPSKKVNIHPAYSTLEGIDQFRVDLAVIYLETPVPTAQARPLNIEIFDPLNDDEFAILAYHRLRPLRLNGRFNCPRFPLTHKNDLHIACHVISGNSGAPAMQYHNGAWQVIGVITASLNSDIAHQALVAPLDQWVIDQVFGTR
jgi:protease YdgD